MASRLVPSHRTERSPTPVEAGTPARIQLFASSPSDPRARRPIDWLRAVLYLLLLVVVALLAVLGRDLEERVRVVLISFPGFLDAFWLVAFWPAVGWSLALLIIAAVRRRPSLVAEGVVAALLALAMATSAGAIVAGNASDVLRRLVDTNGPPVFPPGTVAMTSAVLAVFAPYVTLPFRRFGRALIAAQVIGGLFLGATLALDAVASVTIGLLAGAVVHLLRGSPGGLPTVGRVRSALRDLGLEVDQLAPTSMRRDGVAFLTGQDAEGMLEIKVYGRDAWEGELMASLWRLAWYRGSRRSSRPSRLEYVEHEGFMTFLAANAGVRVPEVVTAGVAENGDALIVVRPVGSPLSVDAPSLTTAQVASLWAELGRLHAAGLSHQRIDLDRVALPDDSSTAFSDLSSASVRADPLDEVTDRVQLLALTALAAGRDTAIEQARSNLGDDRLRELLPSLQAATVPPLLRTALRRQHLDLDDVRKELVAQLGVEDIELAKVRRVTPKSLLNVLLLAVAAYTIIGMLSGLDLRAFGRDLADANWWWLAAALLLGQLPRVANAFSTMGSSTEDLPLGPTTALQFATCYVNLAVPSSAGRIAITTRFFQRFGIPPATALSAGLIDSLSEFVVQIALFLLVFAFSDVDLGLSVSSHQLSGLATTALIIIAALLLAVGIAFVVPSLRAKVLASLGQARQALHVLRSPHKVVQLYGGNLVSQILFAITLGACVRAFGYYVPLSTLILVNSVVTLFAGLLPVPGGIGVTEAGLSLGLTRAGIPSETAFAIALSYRFTTFYLPPIWGFYSYRWLTARRYI
jgi:uncharacterized membrane protein YbhN (UPF0104 family)